jgi:hypothetical protein
VCARARALKFIHGQGEKKIIIIWRSIYDRINKANKNDIVHTNDNLFMESNWFCLYGELIIYCNQNGAFLDTGKTVKAILAGSRSLLQASAGSEAVI